MKNFAGFTIPKGWKVLVWNRGVHMDPGTYNNPKDFDPSRWEVCVINFAKNVLSLVLEH